MNNKLTPEAVRGAILANGGWRGKLAQASGVYRQTVNYWLDRGFIPERRAKDLMRYKAFREAASGQ